MTTGGRLSLTNFTLRNLITMAWDLRDHQLTGGPDWLDSAHFDILAKPEVEIPRTPEGSQLEARMIQAFLTERFGLVFHRETKEMPIYALVVAKNGPKLAAAPANAESDWTMGPIKLTATAMKTSEIAKALSSSLGRMVVDKTSLTGDYTFTLQWASDLESSAATASDGPSIFTAIQEQLGLKLESQKGPVEMFIIDRAEKPSDN